MDNYKHRSNIAITIDYRNRHSDRLVTVINQQQPSLPIGRPTKSKHTERKGHSTKTLADTVTVQSLIWWLNPQ